MNLEVVPYEDEHFGSVRKLWKEAFPGDPARNWADTSISKKLKVQPDLLMVAIENGNVVGSAMAGYDGHRGWLYSVAVLKSHRRRGIGSALVKEAERWLQSLGCPKINLQVRGSNAGVAEFYRQLGYATEERVSMGKILDQGTS